MADPGEKNLIVEAIGGFAITLLSSRGGERLKGGGVYGPTHAVAAAADLATILMTPSLLEPHLTPRRGGTRSPTSSRERS